MNGQRESHVVPIIVAVAGVVALAILVYLLLAGADWLLNRLLGSRGYAVLIAVLSPEGNHPP